MCFTTCAIESHIRIYIVPFSRALRAPAGKSHLHGDTFFALIVDITIDNYLFVLEVIQLESV